MYHLPLAKRFLEQSIWDTDPYFHHYNFPGAMHLHYGLFLYVRAESAIIPFNFLLSLATVVVVYDYCRHFWGGSAAFWSVPICFGSNLIWEVAITPRVDVALAFYFVLACYSLSLWNEDKRQSGYLIIIGMAFGIMAGIKYSSLIFIICILSVLLLIVFIRRYYIERRLVAPFIWLTIATMFPSSFWYARNSYSLSDPMYPMVKNRYLYTDDTGQRRDYQSALVAFSKKIPPAIDQSCRRDKSILYRIKNNQHQQSSMINLFEVIRRPSKFSRFGNDSISSFVILFFYFPVICRNSNSRVLFLIGIISFLAIAAMSNISRYILPSVPLFAIGSAAALQRTLDRVSSRSATAANGAFVLAFCASVYEPYSGARQEWAEIQRTSPGYLLLGVDTPMDY